MTPGSLELGGKAILVTGASRGIGAAIAIACAQAGASELALLARSQDALEVTARAAARVGVGHVGTYPCDLTDTPWLTSTIERLGTVDVLVNCAGTNQPQPFLDVDEETFDRIWELNVKAAFFASQAVARKMIEQGRSGVIVNISSQMGHVGAPRRTVYCTTKHAVEGMTKAVAVELAEHRIRVISIAPTFVRTAMTQAQLDDPAIGGELLDQIPLRQFATAEEVAAAVVFAASDRAASLTGSSLLLDGGWTAK